MFDFKEWVKAGLTEGYASGEFSLPRIVTLTVGYIQNGVLTELDAEEIAISCSPKVEEHEITEE